MDEQVERFFDCIFGKALKNGFGEIELRIISKENSRSVSHFFNSTQDACNKALQLSNNDVYFGVNPRIDKNGKKENVKYLTSFHADIDYGPEHKKPSKWATKSEALTAIEAFSLKPTYIVHSGGGFHCYWVLKEPLSVDEYGIDVLEGINKQLTNELGGDPGTQDISRILRVPDTFNQKLCMPRIVEIVYNSNNLYNYKDILTGFIPKISTNRKKEVKPKPQELSLDTLCTSVKFKKLILAGNTDSYESRSEADMAVIDHLVNNGCTDEQIQSVFQKYAIGDKYRNHNKPDWYLATSIEKARKTSTTTEDDCETELFINGVLTKTGQKVVLRSVPFQEYISKKKNICSDQSSLYRYNGKCYDNCSKNELNCIAQKELNEYRYLFTSTELNQLAHFMEGGNSKDHETMVQENMMYLTLQNGLYDIANNELIPHTHEIFTRNLLPYNFNQNAKCQRFEQYLSEVFDNDIEKIAFVQEAVGYCFHKAIPVASIFFLVGNGSNGKSVFIDVLTYLVGEDNASHISLSSLSDDIYLMQIDGKMLNVSTETVNHRQIDTDKIKAVTSGDEVVGKILYKGPVSFRPYAKHFIAMNQIPQLNDNSHAMRRRVEIIEFSRTFTAKEADPYLTDKLKSEMSGIFNWAIEGYRRLQDNHFKFSKSESMMNQKNEIMNEMNSVIQFAEECINKVKNSKIELSIVYNKYLEYCRNLKQINERKSDFKKILIEQGYTINNSTADHNKMIIFDVEFNDIQ